MEMTMIIAMSGASGFVGSNLRRLFEGRGWQVKPLGRTDFSLPTEGLAQAIEGVDCLVNLAGAPVIGRWSPAYKKILVESRVELTRKLVDACGLLAHPPQVLLSASAIGCYPASGTHTEGSEVQTDDFLGRLIRDWERQAVRAEEFGVRVAIFRFGVVLGGGGALAKMIPPFRLGLGGPIGSGRQPFSWIHLHDLMRVLAEAIADPSFDGVYNLTAPQPTTNAGLTLALAQALSRPAWLPVPEFVLRLLFGEGAQVLTSGQRVLPQRLLERGFSFDFPSIEAAVVDCLAPSS